MARCTTASIALVLVRCLWLSRAGAPEKGAGTGMSMQEQMAWLANGVYTFRSPIAGWTLSEALQLKASCSGENDNFAVYTYAAENKCALAVAGTDSATDMLDNFDGRGVADCGFPDVHSGYMSEVNDLLKACDFQSRFLPLLNSSSCSGGIHVVGHSLGGGVATVFAACANNPLAPYGFNVAGLWTFGAPATSTHPLSNPLASDGCFPGARFWNQDMLAMDPIPGLSRGLNFFHARVNAIRLRQETTLGFPTGEYEAVTYGCGSWESYQKPNPTDATPNPLLHLMSAYASRTNIKYTSDSFSSPEGDGTVTPPGGFSTTCSTGVNYTYSRVKDYTAARTGFDGWGHTSSGYGTSYLIAFLCFVGAAWGYRRMNAAVMAKEALAFYYSQTEMADFFDESRAEMDQDRPEDPMAWLEKFVRKRREEKAHASYVGAPAVTPKSPLRSCCDFIGCKRKRKSKRRHRSPHVQFFVFLVCEGFAKLFFAIARHTLDSYDQSGEVMGRHWFDDNSMWMLPWTLGMIMAPTASMAAFGLVLTLLAYPDKHVFIAHIVGAIVACGELQMMWTENLANTGKLTGIMTIIACLIGIIELGVFLAKRKDVSLAVPATRKRVAVALLIGMTCMFFGWLILQAAPCEHPHNSSCPFPESFNAVAVWNFLGIVNVIMLTMAMLVQIRISESEKVTHISACATDGVTDAPQPLEGAAVDGILVP